MMLERSITEALIYGPSGAQQRFTQDSPVLPDVWIRYGEKPLERQSLLFTPRFGSTPGGVTGLLRERLERHRQENPQELGSDEPRKSADIAYTETYVVADLYFDELVRVVLPLTEWWRDRIGAAVRQWRKSAGVHERGLPAEPLVGLRGERTQKALAQALDDLNAIEKMKEPSAPPGTGQPIPPDLVWMMRLLGRIAWAREIAAKLSLGSIKRAPRSKQPGSRKVVEVVAGLVADLPIPEEQQAESIWLVNLNRAASTAVRHSTLAVKADAARSLFDISCRPLCWGIIDSGIDARHPAFFRRPGPSGEDPRDAFAPDDPAVMEHWAEHTRVKATYDFTRIRELMTPSKLDARESVSPPLKRLLRRGGPELRERLEELKSRLIRGRPVDWSLLEPFLRVPHDDHYVVPSIEHGTHVAGILAADWPQQNGLEGVCPDINLYDLRVLGPEKAKNDEFGVLAALQFVRYLNDQKDFFAVHGVNVSLSIRHDVANFACGSTPVCDECERLVAAGVVVVAAAGNDGYVQYLTSRGQQEGYHTVSITDPGNAEKVITVGATHRFQPHTYGVSYFSSRGPTGDGRIKPDVVAPGEKISAPTPDLGLRRKDGTSMAAPHVSGAAALLMARHAEMIGQPDRVKAILCGNATDLRRERYFQGAGMLDVLRALQSV